MVNKRILIFSLAYHPFIGGAEVAVKEITDRVKDVDFDMVTMQFSKKDPREERVGNVQVHRIKASKMTFPIEAMLLGKKLHKERKYDAIWAIMAARAGGAALFFKYSFPEVPFILTLQEGDPVSYMKLRSLYYINPFFKKIFLNADIIQVISEYLSAYARTMGAKNKIEVIPNAVDYNFFSNTKNQNLKNTLGKRDDEIFLITTSRLVKKNDVASVIRAMALLPPNVRFLVVGTGPLESKLKALAEKLSISRRVQFFGHVPNEEIPHYLHVSDIFIRPSLSEGFGISFIEAMAAGLPVITTPVGGIVDFLYDPDETPGKPSTGLFVTPMDPVSIREQVVRLINDSQLRQTLIQNGKDLVRTRYDWDLVARDMKEKVFDPMLRRG